MRENNPDDSSDIEEKLEHSGLRHDKSCLVCLELTLDTDQGKTYMKFSGLGAFFDKILFQSAEILQKVKVNI